MESQPNNELVTALDTVCGADCGARACLAAAGELAAILADEACLASSANFDPESCRLDLPQVCDSPVCQAKVFGRTVNDIQDILNQLATPEVFEQCQNSIRSEPGWKPCVQADCKGAELGQGRITEIRFKAIGCEQIEPVFFDAPDAPDPVACELNTNANAGAAHGADAVVEFYSSLERDWGRLEVDAAFAEVFGLSYEQAIEAYEAEAAALYPGYGWCENVDVVEVSTGETQVTLRADCDRADTYTFADPPIDAMYIRRVLNFEQRSTVSVEASAPIGVLNRHPCFEAPAATEDDPRLESRYEDIAGGVPPMGTLLGPMDMAAGSNLVEFVFPLGGPVEVELTFFAAPLPGG